MDLPLPARLQRLFASGEWPTAHHALMSQNLRSLFAADRVPMISPEESEILLYGPPFLTVAAYAAKDVRGHFWRPFGSLEMIDPERVLVIADFGPGSDAPIALDYSHNMAEPTVIRLHWLKYPATEWVECAGSFDEFADILGLGAASG